MQAVITRDRLAQRAQPPRPGCSSDAVRSPGARRFDVFAQIITATTDDHREPAWKVRAAPHPLASRSRWRLAGKRRRRRDEGRHDKWRFFRVWKRAPATPSSAVAGRARRKRERTMMIPCARNPFAVAFSSGGPSSSFPASSSFSSERPTPAVEKVGRVAFHGATQ